MCDCKQRMPLVFAALLMVCALPAAARSLIVATDGSDRAEGSLSAPLRTLAVAAERARPGDSIELRAGVHEGAVIRNPGRADAWIRLRAYGKEKAVIQGKGTHSALYFYHRSCDEDRADKSEPCQPLYWEVQGLEVRGSPEGAGDGNTIKIDTPRVRLIGNDLCCSRADVIKLVRTADDVEIIGNRIHHPHAKNGDNAQGVDIVGAKRTRVAFNHVHDIPSIGMYAKGNARHTVFEHNRVERTWSHAIMLGQSTDKERLVDGRYESYDGVIRDNVISEAGWSCFATASSFKVRIHNNTCHATGLQMHGSVLVSNESEVGQAGTAIDIHNNLIVGGSRLPVIKVTSNALTDDNTLQIDHNVYAMRHGAEASFTWRGRWLESAGIARWRDKTGLDHHSLVLASPEGLFTDQKDFAPKPGGPLWDARHARPPAADEVVCASPRPTVGARPACMR